MNTYYKYALALCLLAASIASKAADFEYSWDMFYQNIPPKDYPGVDYGQFFERRSGATPSSGTGPSSGAEGSNYYIFLESSSGSAYDYNDTAYLETGSVWYSTVENATSMSFYYHMYGADIGTLAVEVYANGSWRRIWNLSGQQHSSSTASWSKESINLDIIKSSLGSFNSVRFVAVASGGYRGDMAIDKIEFQSSTDNTIRYIYDALGRVVCVIDHANGEREYKYDAAGNRTDVSVGACNN
jgi:YD repeat-containing protein